MQKFNRKVYIAGAHSRAATFGQYLTYLEPDISIEAYLYDNDEDNPKEIKGVPVIKIDKSSMLKKELPVYLATRGVNHTHISGTLSACGMKNIIPVDVAFDMEIRNKYLSKFFESCGRDFIKVEQLDTNSERNAVQAKDAVIYVASSALDKPLKEKIHLDYYEKKLQVGTAITQVRIDADKRDNTGENISDKNTQFCELTGLYWIWKNATEDVQGLVHYRRHFLLPESWLSIMCQNDIDVILPVPLYVYPSVAENYRRRHEKICWEYMMEYLMMNSPDDYIFAKDYFENNCIYYPCNMFIMRRDILNELCSWMFPIIFYVADKVGVLEDTYQNRYPGFLSERLITLFFEKYRDRYKIVYSDKGFSE